VSTPRFRKVYSSDEVEGSIPGSGVGKINSTELAAYTLSRYLLSKMDNSASRPPNSISSRENHAKLNKTSQMDQPRLSHNLPIAYNDSGDSMPSGFMPSSRSPFAHPGGQDATLAISMSPERATFPAIAEIINRPPSLPGRSLSPENPERPCERWLREQREARPATPSATPFPSSPSAQRRHSQSCFSASSAKGLGCKPDQLVNQSSNSGAVKELRDRVKRQWQEGRSEPPKPAYLSQAPPPDAGGPYTVSVSRNPFYDLASRTSTPSPFRQAAEITSWIKGESENVPGRSNLNLSIGSEQPCRSSAMSRSSSNEGQLGLIERAKDKAKHEKDLQAFSGELLSWPQTMSNKLETSSDGVLTPCASSNTSGSSGDCVTPPESEPISKGEELYDGSEESCSSTVDQTCDTVGKSVAEKQHGAAKQSTREFSFTHHTSDILRSCPANGGSSSSRSASDALPSVAPGRPSTGTVHRQKPKGRQLPTDEYGEADSDEDGDEENKRQQGTTGDPFVTRDKGRLACPYHARSPSKHYKYTSCYARGFSTVHRVK
jgi:hypothetical protein